ncbi:hypothetical protein, partial [Geobacillus sp. WSUCF1]|uniref:hypothetical protein n=1 Tax=Geobacillus sp. WSUCF1 TaxID=886559 RepID=UPI000518ED90
RNKTENGGILLLQFGLIFCSKMKVLLHGVGDLSFRMLGDTFILLEIRQQGLFLCLIKFI